MTFPADTCPYPVTVCLWMPSIEPPAEDLQNIHLAYSNCWRFHVRWSLSCAGHIEKVGPLKGDALRPCIAMWTCKTWLSHQYSKAVLMYCSHRRQNACQALQFHVRNQAVPSNCAGQWTQRQQTCQQTCPESSRPQQCSFPGYPWSCGERQELATFPVDWQRRFSDSSSSASASHIC